MTAVIVALACVVATQYMVIGIYVVPRLAALADEPGPLIRAAQWGAGAFFVGCGLTHLGIAIHAATEPAQGAALHLFLVHVGPHIAQVVGGATFIWIAAHRLEVRFTPKHLATVERARDQAVEELRRAEERFRTAFERAPLGMALVSLAPERSGCFMQVNPALSRITGYPQDDLLHRPLEVLLPPEDRGAGDGAAQWLSGAQAAEAATERRLLHRDGHPVWVSVSTSLVPSQDGRPGYAIAQVQDITERRRFEERLRHLADHDALTGLLNRRSLAREIDVAVESSRRSGVPSALAVIDLDNFKEVNDLYGHAVGDDLIRRVGHTLRDRARRTDRVARLGGDEFAILLRDVHPDQAETLAETYLQAVREHGAVGVEDRRVTATASVGISVVSPERALTGDELLMEADMAMYDAKEAGGDRSALVDGVTGRQGNMRLRLSWSQRIRDALEAGGFELHEQPIMTLDTGRTTRSELLLRMRGDDGELLSPGLFLDVAERFGHMPAIDRWVVREAIALLARRERARIPGRLEVNLSGSSVTDTAMLDWMVGEIVDAGVDPRRLVFEVTETSAIESFDRARAFAERLADLGCQFALDDFGAGFGSFYYLKRLPFDCVKIDGDFIKSLPASPADQHIVKAVVDSARGLGKETIAEFVEDEATLALLRGYGVDHAQGFHIGRPGPVGERAARQPA